MRDTEILPLYEQCKVAEAALTSPALESFPSVYKKKQGMSQKWGERIWEKESHVSDQEKDRDGTKLSRPEQLVQLSLSHCYTSSTSWNGFLQHTAKSQKGTLKAFEWTVELRPQSCCEKEKILNHCLSVIPACLTLLCLMWPQDSGKEIKKKKKKSHLPILTMSIAAYQTQKTSITFCTLFCI